MQFSFHGSNWIVLSLLVLKNYQLFIPETVHKPESYFLMISSSARNSSAQSKPQNSTQWPTFTSSFSQFYSYKFYVKSITENKAYIFLQSIWKRCSCSQCHKMSWELNIFFMFNKSTKLFWISPIRMSARTKRKKLCFALKK